MEEMEVWKNRTGGDKSSPTKRKHESPGTNKGGFKSKEYISDDDSSDSDSGAKKKVAKVCCFTDCSTTVTCSQHPPDHCFRSKTRKTKRRKVPRRTAKAMTTKRRTMMKKRNPKQNQLERIAIKCCCCCIELCIILRLSSKFIS